MHQLMPHLPEVTIYQIPTENMKRALLAATICIASFTCVQAQNVVDSAGVVNNTGNFIKLDKEPRFPGGLQALMQYIHAHIHYPDNAFADNVQGVVTILFTVNKEGKATNAVVQKGIGKGCDEEALKLIDAMPLWSPGEYKGRKVDVLYRLPIHFTIPDKIPEHDGETTESPLVYRYVDELPEFPGGKEALIKYLSGKLPELTDRNNLNNAMLEFLVQSNGKISNIRLLNARYNDASTEETLSAIANHMPRWTPGRVNGKTVNTYYNLAVGEF